MLIFPSIILITFLCLASFSLQEVKHCKTPGIMDGDEICLDCEKGYYLNVTYSDEECKKCPHDCGDCVYRSDTKIYSCRACESGYRFSTPNLTCTKCPSHCSQCDDKNVCSACETGYALQESKSCASTGSKAYQYLFIAAIVVGFAVLGYYVYTKYFVKQEHTINEPDYEAAAYNNPGNKDLKKSEVIGTPSKGGKRANAELN